MEKRWPLHSYLPLGALEGAVPCARLHTRQLLREWGVHGDAAFVMELLVSELASNALHATWAMAQGAYIRFWLLSDKTSVIVSVWDCNPHPPVQVKADEDAESGRGLTIVDAMCDRWDWYAHKGFGGKVVWCELFLDSRRHTPGSQASHDLQ